jgi:hypothetical protein
MRYRHLLFIAAIIAVGFGTKLFFFSSSIAEADIEVDRGVRINIEQLHQNVANLPEEKIDDMAFGTN